MMCLAPVIMTGYLLTMQPNKSHTSNVDGTVWDAQTCESGLGLHVRAQTAGLYSLGTQYGFTLQYDDWTITLQPRAGLSYNSVTYRELPAQGQFELGTVFSVGYKDFRVGLDYWHLSNAGLKAPNIGLDMMGVMVGMQF